MSDPFAVEPDEAQQPAEPPAQTATPRTTSEVIVSGEHFPIKVTLKGGSGYDAPWLTYDFRSIAEADEVLNGPDGARLAEVLARVQTVAEFFVSKNTAPAKTSAPRSGGGGSTGSSAPAWMGSPPDCAHGTRKYVTKLRADGSAWHAWGCVSQKGEESCDPGLIFKNPPKK